MTIAYPMTLIVAVALAASLVAGLVIMLRSLSARRSREEGMCRRCRNANPAHAKFCAHCGHRLSP